MITTPFINSRTKVNHIMLDVYISLMPIILIACFTFGFLAINVFLVAILTSIIGDGLLSYIFLHKRNTVFDLSSGITGILLAFTLSPFTPLYVVAFGSFAAIFFGKILWGGLGKNLFNPALVGREYMSVFFPVVMMSPQLWNMSPFLNFYHDDNFINFQSSAISSYFDSLILESKGALGEYSILAIIVGGIYLILRRRISWHIPFSIFGVWTILNLIASKCGYELQFSTGGVLIGGIFMATDMPTSPVNPYGKLYFGAMIAIVAIIFIKTGISNQYLSYAILLLNGFNPAINSTFQPRPWGGERDLKQKIESIFLLTLKIVAVSLAILSVHEFHIENILVYVFTAYIIFKYVYTYSNKIKTTI